MYLGQLSFPPESGGPRHPSSRSEFTERVGRRYTAIHEEVVAGDKRAVSAHQECADGSHLVRGAGSPGRSKCLSAVIRRSNYNVHVCHGTTFINELGPASQRPRFRSLCQRGGALTGDRLGWPLPPRCNRTFGCGTFTTGEQCFEFANVETIREDHPDLPRCRRTSARTHQTAPLCRLNNG